MPVRHKKVDAILGSSFERTTFKMLPAKAQGHGHLVSERNILKGLYHN